MRPLLALLAATCAALPAAAAARTVLVIGTHPDDEALAMSGRTRVAFTRGDVVKTVVVTNGDYNASYARGIERETESVATAVALGLAEDDVIFLGYPDGGLRDLWDATSGTQVFTSSIGRTTTYAEHGLGRVDWHTHRTGAAGTYARATIAADFRDLLATYRPDEVYTHSDFESHTDHQAVAMFVVEALIALQRAGAALPTKVYHGVVWMPGNPYPWPQWESTGWTPLVPFLPRSSPCDPGLCLDLTPRWEWRRVARFPQPPEMLALAPEQNVKALAIPAGLGGGWLGSWVRRDEFFWRLDGDTNLAFTAAVTASSQDLSQGASAASVADGVASGAPDEPRREWVSAGQLGGAWIQLDWPGDVRVAQVNLWDRPSPAENVTAGTLTFSDGTSLSTGPLPADGQVLPFLFPPKTVRWVRFTIDAAAGTAAGLAELEALGAPATATANLPPHFVDGPFPASETVLAADSTAVTALGHDLDGDLVQYAWTADGGTLTGSGATVQFVPPAVTAESWFTITAQLADGRGGTSSRATFVRVVPALAVAGVSLAPAAVVGGSTSTATVTLTVAAPTGGVAVALSSGDPAASVPASVTVPAGATSATFPVATTPVAASRSAAITATSGASSASATLTVRAPAASSVTLSPTSVPGGRSSAGTVTLNGPAPAGGFPVTLSSNSASATVSASSLTIAAGATSAGFTVSTTPVTANVSATISATAGGTRRTATLTVARARVSSLSVTPSIIVGGSPTTATVTLTGPAPAGGLTVTPGSSNLAAATVPASVLVPAGATSATFPVSTAPVAASASVTLSATLDAVTVNASLTVRMPGVSAFSLAPSTIRGGTACSGTVTLNAPAAAGGAALTMRITGAGATVSPAPVVPAGATSVTFPVTTAPVGSTLTPRITATFGGSSRTATLTVTPPAAVALSVSPGTVQGGAGSTATVTLDGLAPAGGTTVTLSSGNPAASVPPSVVVPAGAASFSFPVTTSVVLPSTVVPLTASGGGGSASGSLTVRGLAVLSLSLSPTSVVGGSTSTGTVTLTGPAPADFTVGLRDNGAAASEPASVVVPQGASSVTFTVSTVAVAAPTSVNVTASGVGGGGGSASAALTITP